MVGVIVVLPKAEDARNIKNILVRNGISVSGTCTTGAQALALADNLNDGIVICGYKMADMIYTQLREYLPSGFDMLLMASQQVIGGGMIEGGIMCLAMPLKVLDLVNTVNLMAQAIEQQKRRRKSQPRKRDAGEVKLIKEAKEVLMSRNHMTEEEAHRYIQKCSMDSGTNMAETAKMVLGMVKGSADRTFF